MITLNHVDDSRFTSSDLKFRHVRELCVHHLLKEWNYAKHDMMGRYPATKGQGWLR
jgi:hypothetical protein